ncbi:hypothetical protein [Halobacterium yunchengense]|uniref:hypothetical protein n=1 Tax=Halobacterium yunchengense TaxID=3108497 RepID=UPI00300B0614
MTERTLKDVSQRNPAAPEHSRDVFDRMFQRGPDVAADGGERGAAKRRGADDPAEDGEQRAAGETVPVDEQTLKHVDKTPPGEDEGANPVWERGGEPGVREADAEDADE